MGSTTIVIDQDFFSKYGITREQNARILNSYPDCIVVRDKKEINTNHHYMWYQGQIVLTSENFELGRVVFFQEIKYHDDRGYENISIVHENDVYLEIPEAKNSDSTNEGFYNLEFFRQKRIYESEKDLDYKLIWSLDRVAFLRKKRFSAKKACERVSEQSGIDFDTIYNGYCKRAINLRWAKKDYEKSRI